MARFKPGDCVQLKHSDGPKMTVSAVLIPENRGYTCMWFNKGDLKTENFTEEVLEPCSEKEEGPTLA
jgi:uncharacterized protein YodC (DUF2158 family)